MNTLIVNKMDNHCMHVRSIIRLNINFDGPIEPLGTIIKLFNFQYIIKKLTKKYKILRLLYFQKSLVMATHFSINKNKHPPKITFIIPNLEITKKLYFESLVR